MSLCVVFRESPNQFGNDLLNLARPARAKQFGGHKAVVRPVPIPNTAVKHSLANGSGCIASARVGCRHSFNKNPEKILRVFLFLNSLIYFNVQTQLSLKLFPSRSARAATWFSPGDNFTSLQIKTPFVLSSRLPCEFPLSDNSTSLALE